MNLPSSSSTSSWKLHLKPSVITPIDWCLVLCCTVTFLNLSFAFYDIVFLHIIRSLFQEPDCDEGFEEIVKVNFIPKFEDENIKELYMQFLFEGLPAEYYWETDKWNYSLEMFSLLQYIKYRLIFCGWKWKIPCLLKRRYVIMLPYGDEVRPRPIPPLNGLSTGELIR